MATNTMKVPKTTVQAVLALLVALSLAFACTGCSSQPKEIDAVGLTLGEAFDQLTSEGWWPNVIDDTPNSDYVPGQYESGEGGQYADCAVTSVTYKPELKDDPRFQHPIVMIHFESGDQGQLEEIYSHIYDTYLTLYQSSVEEYEKNGASSAVSEFLQEAVVDLEEEEEEERVSISRLDDHHALLAQYRELLAEVTG